MNKTQADLLAYMRTLHTFDSHEHLIPETERLQNRMDFTVFLQMYVKGDLLSAGMPPDHCQKMLHDSQLSEDQRFALLEPYLPLLSQSSTYRAARIALRDIYGFDGIDRGNYQAIGQALRAANKPGLYRHILKDRCHLGHIINQKVLINNEGGLFHCNAHIGFYHGPTLDEMHARFAEQQVDCRVCDLESFDAALQNLFATWRRKNILALKMGVREMNIPSRKQTDQILRTMTTTGRVPSDHADSLAVYVMDFFLNQARQHDYVMAVHTGPMAAGGDFRTISPCHLIPWAARYPDVKFDMYHMGIPYARQAGFVAKYYPNVTANLCWAHVVAPQVVVNALDEWLDFLPVNKIIAFGGDYSGCVEKVYGALEMARANLAQVMTRRIARADLDLEEAKVILRKVLVDNGRQLYRLQ